MLTITVQLLKKYKSFPPPPPHPPPIQKEENLRRAQRGESQLSISDEIIEQELNLKPIQPPPRLDALLIGEHVDSKCRQITEVAAETFAKLYLSEGLQQK